MEIQTPIYPVADYLRMLERAELRINRDYQRSPRIWPDEARSFLVETVLLNFPMPKLSLHQKTDPVSLDPWKELVDGQQRTYALKDFREGKFRLSERLDRQDLRGKRFDDLEEPDRRQFLNYGLNFDLFVGADDREVREIFRRMNTFTVPLNDEEQRHANWDGLFKWFIRELTSEYAEPFIIAGVFRERGLLRMSDAKLLTEISHAFLNGITTTNKRSLDRLYKDQDDAFPQRDDLGLRLRRALDLVFSWEAFHGSPLMGRTYVFYSLVLATMHAQEPIEALQEQIPAPGPLLDQTAAESGLSRIAGALAASQEESEDGDDEFVEFVDASTTKTNVAAQRLTRTRWLYRALTDASAQSS